MTMLHVSPVAPVAMRIGVRRIGESDLKWALAEGWGDFLDKRGDQLVLALLYPLIGYTAVALAFNSDLSPMLFPAVAGLSILGPAVASGFYEIARRREAGEQSTWRHFLDPMAGRSRDALAILTAGLVALFILWQASAWLIYAATLGQLAPRGALNLLRELFTTPQGWTMIIVGNLVGFVFAAVTITVSIVSFPMVIDRPVDPMTAVSASIRAVTANPRAAASWGLKVVGLLALGCLPAFIGLTIVLPVLGYATWHLYTRLVEQ